MVSVSRVAAGLERAPVLWWERGMVERAPVLWMGEGYGSVGSCSRVGGREEGGGARLTVKC